MKMSELSQRSGVSVATIKYYLRNGLLAEGVKSSPNQAHYDDGHVQRLRLIRALVEVGRLPLGAVREVLGHIDRPPAETLDLLAVAQDAVTSPPGEPVDQAPAFDLLRRLGWSANLEIAEGQADGDIAVAALASALGGLADAGLELPEDLLDRFGAAMLDVARAEVAGIPTDSPTAAVRYVVLGTVLSEPVLLALRRLAQREASGERFATQPD